MATPRTLHIYVLDDGISEISNGSKSFFLLDVREENRQQFKNVFSTNVPIVNGTNVSFAYIYLNELNDELQNLFRRIHYENYYELHKALWDYSILKTYYECNQIPNSEIVLIKYLATLSHIVSKVKIK